MKLKKLAAGACALALGAAMMAMPAFAATNGLGETYQAVTATGKTVHTKKVEIEWTDCAFTYTRTWNADDLKYDYEETWTQGHPTITITNYSDVAVSYRMDNQPLAGITLTADNESGTVSAAGIGTTKSAKSVYTITGTPTSFDLSDTITLGTIRVNIS